MKLVKLYANKNFKNIEFNPLFNVVLATILEKDKNKDTHNLGKTSLIHVINFILLGSFNKAVFENNIFSGVVFYGEIELNTGNFLIIRREIDTPTRISFKVNEFKSLAFTSPQNWDDENMPFEKSRKHLNELLGFDVILNYDYRKSITYFLRSQQDYLDVYKLNKFKGKHIDWKPFVFELLGYDGTLIEQKLKIEDEIEAKRNTIRVLKTENRVDVGDRDRLVGLLEIKKQDSDEAKTTIDKFNFYEQDKLINQDLIEIVDLKIQEFSTDRYRIDYEISKIEESLVNIVEEVNIVDLAKMFDEVNMYFSSELKKEFEDLLKFNKAISKDRKKYLIENLSELKEDYKSIDTSIRQLEIEKSEKLSFLTEKDSYSKFKEYQKELSKTEAEIERLKDKINAVDQSLAIESDIANLQTQVESKVQEIRNVISLRKHAEINKIFNSIIHDILGTNALISIKPNKLGNVEFDANYQNPNDFISTSEAQGTTYKKLLCMAFDLSLLVHYSKNSFFRFVYHDGILEGLDNRIKIKLLDKVKQLCTEYNIQYILSLIDSDIPVDQAGRLYNFTKSEICLELNDKDESGTLFLHNY